MILDIIAIVIIAYCIYSGMKKGLIKGLFSSLTFVIALAVTIGTVGAVTEYVSETEFGKSIYEATEIAILEHGGEDEGNFSIPLIDTENLLNEAIETQENISRSLGDLAVKSLCAVALFVGYFIIIKLAVNILDAVAKLPVLKTFNKIGGVLAGAVNAYIFMIILSCLLMLVSSTAMGETIKAQLESSKIAIWFYNNNPIL